MNKQYAAMIVRFPLLEGFTLQGAEGLLVSGQIKEYAPGAVLFTEGEPPSFVLLVLEGKLTVFVQREGRDLVLTEAVPGTILGELAVLCGIQRSASVRASEKSTVLEWSADAFRSLLRRDALLWERILGQSLRTLIAKERSLIDLLMQSQNTAI